MFSPTKLYGRNSVVYLPVIFQFVLKIMILYVYYILYYVSKKVSKVVLTREETQGQVA